MTDRYEKIRRVLTECRDIAMGWTILGRIPECGKFGQIAQDLDYVCAELEMEKTVNTLDMIELPPLPKGDIAADTCPVMWVHSNEQLQAYAREAIEIDRQRRGEPVYQVNMKGNGWEDCSVDRYESAGRAMEQDVQKGWKRWDRRVLWTAPQPAEPVSKTDWNSELSSWSDEDFIRIFHEHPDLANRLRKMLADPVKRKRRPYNASGSLSEFGVIPMCDQVGSKL